MTKGEGGVDTVGFAQSSQRLQIIEVILQFARSLDIKDWELCRACFADQVEADYSDLRGELPTVIAADDFVGLRRRALQPLATQHLSTNHLVTFSGNEATCISNAVIYRRLDSCRYFNTHAIYQHTLVQTPNGWKICKVKQTVLWNEGDPQIHAGVQSSSTDASF